MEEKAKKEISLLLIPVTKKEESNLFFNCDSVLWKYEIHPIKGDEKYFKEGKKYYLGDNYIPSHTLGLFLTLLVVK